MRRLICGVIAVTLLLLTRTTRAETIQPILTGMTTPSAGVWRYEYTLVLTANNGLANANTPTSGFGFESGLIMPDFQGFTGNAFLQQQVGDVTTVAQWGSTVYAALDGGGPLSSVLNATNVSTTILGSPNSITTGQPPVATVGDSSSFWNIILQYQGAELAVSGASRQLIHLYVDTTAGSLVSDQNTLSRDTKTNDARPVETFGASMPDPGHGQDFLPLPSTAGLGLVLLGGLGLGRARRLKLA